MTIRTPNSARHAAGLEENLNPTDRPRHQRTGGRRPWQVTMLVGVLLCAAGTILFLAYPDRLSSNPTFMSPHENVRYRLAQQWLLTGRPTYRVPTFERLPSRMAPALTPRDAALLGEWVVPKDFPYAVGAVALLLAVDPRLPLLLTTFSGMAVLLLTGLLAWELSRSLSTALLAAVLIATSTTFFAASAGLLETGATVAAAVLAGTLALCRGRRTTAVSRREVLLDLVAGACFGLAIGLHHGSILLVAGLVSAFIGPRSGGCWQRWLALGVGVAGALLPMLAYDTWLFGSPLTTGYHVGGRFFDEHFEHHSAGLFDVRVTLLAQELQLYLLRPEVLLVILAATIVVVNRRKHGHPAVRSLGMGALIGGLTYLSFMGARPLWGMDSFQIDASFLRYGLPVFALAIVLAASTPAIVTAGWRRAIVWTVACVPLVFGLAATLFAPQGPLELRTAIATGARMRHAVLSATPPGAVILTARGDKFLWPERTTITAAYLVGERQPNGRDHPVYAAVPTPAQVADVLTYLVEDGQATYIWNDGWLDPTDPTLDRLLRQRNICGHHTGVVGLIGYSPPSPIGSSAARCRALDELPDDAGPP